MLRCNIRILPPTFPDSAISTPTVGFILSPVWDTDGNLMASGWAGHHSTTATGFTAHNLAGLLSEANPGDGCLTTMAVGFSNLESDGCGLRLDSVAATWVLDSIPSRRHWCVPAAPWPWFPRTRRIVAARRR